MKLVSTLGLLLSLLTNGAVAQTPADARFGTYFGANLFPDGDDSPHFLFGVSYVAPAFGIVEWYPAVDVLVPRTLDGTFWQVLLNLRVRPGSSEEGRVPWYVGGGLKVRSDTFDPGVLVGLEGSFGAAHPFAEVRFYGSDRDRARLDVLVGASFAAR